ncbi:MAG: PfkB family carbohydrate kinase [Planctomycetota bacterium]|nr:PfkB family carbohydrate kinase [Planctomycetota bacterium]
MLSPNVVPDFTRLRVAVVGDLIADRYLFARPTRISREAPVLVMRHDHEVIGAGGAANVARNLWALGAETFLIGAVGRNADGRDLLRLLEQEQIDVGGVVTVPEWTTPTKTRILGAERGRTPHQVLRIDQEPDAPLEPKVTGAIADRVRALAGSVDALLVSDYGYGLIDEAVAEAALALQAAGTMVVLDPRERIDHFRGVTGLTPNLAELARLVGEPEESVTSPADVTRAAAKVMERADPRWLLVTLGNRGMVLYAPDLSDGVAIAASGSDQVIDVSGAGDTAAAAFTLGIAAGVDGPRAMRLANAASGVVVMESGTAVCTLSKLRSALPLSPQPARAVRTAHP